MPYNVLNRLSADEYLDQLQVGVTLRNSFVVFVLLSSRVSITKYYKKLFFTKKLLPKNYRNFFVKKNYYKKYHRDFFVTVLRFEAQLQGASICSFW